MQVDGLRLQEVANERYCDQMAGFVIRIAERNADADLAEAAMLIADAARSQSNRRFDVTPPLAREAEWQAAKRGSELARGYSIRFERSVLEDELLACARSL